MKEGNIKTFNVNGVTISQVFNPMLDIVSDNIIGFTEYSLTMFTGNDGYVPVDSDKQLIVHPFTNNKYSIGCVPITGNRSAIVFKRGRATWFGLLILVGNI